MRIDAAALADAEVYTLDNMVEQFADGEVWCERLNLLICPA
jgi:hypothetical protein